VPSSFRLKLILAFGLLLGLLPLLLLVAAVGFHNLGADAAAAEPQLRAALARDAGTLETFLTLLVLAGLGAGGWLAFSLTRGITAGLGQVAAHLERVADGEIARDLPADETERQDEFGSLCRAIQRTIAGQRSAFTEMGSGIQSLSASAAQFSALSGRISDSTADTSQRASAVAAAAEEMCVTSSSVASSVDTATSNLEGIADATSQMTSTIAEIAATSAKARVITEKASQQAGGITTTMTRLGEAAEEVGKVTDTIAGISSQTNLLALNATIEAARAGTAGKGFGVVANEVKELAQQTSAAAVDIKRKITGIQASTRGAVNDIREIATVIQNVSDLVSSIAVAIEEQSVVSQDIASNIGGAMVGVREANGQVSETSRVSLNIAMDIAAVDESAGHIAEGTGQVSVAAQELTALSERLNALVGRFKV